MEHKLHMAHRKMIRREHNADAWNFSSVWGISAGRWEEVYTPRRNTMYRKVGKIYGFIKYNFLDPERNKIKFLKHFL